MHERKQTMFDRADAFVALPGGVGTLEELVEQMTWAQLNRHAKPILIVNIGGFWRPLLALFAHMHIEGFIREGFDLRYLVAERIEDVLPMLRAAAERRLGRARSRRTPSLLATCNGEAPQGRRHCVLSSWLFLRHRGAILANASSCGLARVQEEIHDETELGRGACRGAMRPDRGAGARAERGPAAAAAPTKLKPKTPTDASTVTVTVTNSRKADLVQLQAAESGSVSWKKVLGALKTGKQAPAKLPQGFNCRVDLHGTFADGQSMDASDVDVCAQKTLNLTD